MPGVIAPPPLLALRRWCCSVSLLDWLLPAYVLTAAAVAVRSASSSASFSIGGGAALAFPPLRTFRSAGTHVEPWKPSTALVTDGIFGRMRNPMYVGGNVAAWPASPFAGVGLDAGADCRRVPVILHFGVVKREERYLEAKFGDAYRAYKARVPRYGWPA